eukprot:TRINITY_DN780147_c0_g1_i1.p1 TRINITY_DN780147_c0_g1~~TRINITY_DN780147_c0_g1_i1.p1  ORF type:complete len:423 (+),score=88.23 TRINITY_DN780147_c0_g1_i1:134-1402(+)
MQIAIDFLNELTTELNNEESLGVSFTSQASFLEGSEVVTVLEIRKSVEKNSKTGYERYFNTLNHWEIELDKIGKGMGIMMEKEIHQFKRRSVSHKQKMASFADSIAFIKTDLFTEFITRDGFSVIEEGLTKCRNVGLFLGPGRVNFHLPFDNLLHRPKTGIPFCIHTFMCFKDEFPEESDVVEGFYDAFLISGGTDPSTSHLPWILRLEKVIRFIHEESLAKIVGFCFAHKIIARTFGGTVEKNPNGFETGFRKVYFKENGQKLIEKLAHSGALQTDYESYEILPHSCFKEALRLSNDDKEQVANRSKCDFDALKPNEARFGQSHFRRVATAPEGWKIVCGNEMTPIQSMYHDRILTLQFHPEFNYSYWQQFLAIFREKIPHKIPADLEDSLSLPNGNDIMTRAIVGFITMDPHTKYEDLVQ